MKKVLFIWCNEAILRANAPISFFSEANLYKAAGMLENGACDFLYVAIDHFNDEKKERAERYFTDFISNFDELRQAKIFVSASTKPPLEMFAEYVRQIPGEVSVDILARVDERYRIKKELNDILDEKWMNENENETKLIFLN